MEGIASGFEYKTVPHITLKSIANDEPPAVETLYDKPYVDNKKTRVTSPFTVEAVPAPTVKSLDTIEAEQGAGDTSVSRTGETHRQAEWRDELLKTGVRAKGGKLMEFVRVEPMSGTRYIQAEAETKVTMPDKNLFEKEAQMTFEQKPQKVLIVFGPEHAPLETRTVEYAIEEARWLKPDILLFCAFQFDEEAAKDIDETPEHLIGFTLLKAQMNADLLTDDLRKKRSSNESFWLVGQPDVKVDGYEFLVYSDKVVGNYDIIKELSGLTSLAEIHQLSHEDLQNYLLLSQGRVVWDYLANAESRNIHSGKHRRGAGKTAPQGISAIYFDSTRLVGRVRDFYHYLPELGIPNRSELKTAADRLLGNKENVIQLKEIAKRLNFPQLKTKNYRLKTKKYAQVEVMGFDYYNPKSGKVESGGKKNIAMWMLDTDYDNRAVFPSQVFFPMAGKKTAGQGWQKI